MRSRNVETDPIKRAVNYACVGVRNEEQRPEHRLQGDVTATAYDYGRLEIRENAKPVRRPKLRSKKQQARSFDPGLFTLGENQRLQHHTATQ